MHYVMINCINGGGQCHLSKLDQTSRSGVSDKHLLSAQH